MRIIVRAIGLDKGTGTIVCKSIDEVLVAVRQCLNGEFGTVGNKIIIERDRFDS